MDVPRPEPLPEIVISDLETLKIYFDPLRSKILQLVANHPRTVQEVAAALQVPFTRLYYQFNLLEKHNLIRVVETRQGAGAIEEKYYQITARLYAVDRKLLMPGSPTHEEGLRVILASVLDTTKQDIERSALSGAIDLLTLSPHPDSLLARRGIYRLSRQQAQWFHERLRELLQEVSRLTSEGEDQHDYAFTVALYPTVFTTFSDVQPSDTV